MIYNHPGMFLANGERLGPYEIVEQIGAGGMGEVYKARDTRLDRIVALKVSKAEFSERFHREARAVAALNHPNIAALYDVGPNYLVMEYVEGDPPKGPYPLDEAMRIASQIAQALDAAHEKNIVHRDLKPANIKIRLDGTVKVLDFGLAKIAAPPSSPGSLDPEHSPTVSLGGTQFGTVVGTAPYMSPEQARGKEDIDRRADIWSFGVVLYELITGERLFKGRDMGEILACVIKEEPKLDKVPAQVRPLIERCLVKDRVHRLRDIGDIDLLLNPPRGEAPDLPAEAQGMSSRRWLWPAIAAAALLAGAGGTYWARSSGGSASNLPMKLTILPPEGAQFTDVATSGGIALSPDGRSIAFVALKDGQEMLYVRPLDSLEARVLPGTEGAERPFWSPDSKTLGFMAQSKMKRVDLSGGSPQTLADMAGVRGAGAEGAFSRDGRNILFAISATSSLFLIPSSGGERKEATELDSATGEMSHLWPEFLPDGKHFLYHVRLAGGAEFQVQLGTIDPSRSIAADRRVLVKGVSNAKYAPPRDGYPGYLLYVRDGALMAHEFDDQRLVLTGEPVPVAPQVSTTTNATGADFSVAPSGILAYRAGGGPREDELAWYDRAGKKTDSVLKRPTVINQQRLSPDGRMVAFHLGRQGSGQAQDVWLLDLARGVDSRLTFNGGQNPVWSPDGSRIVFSRFNSGILAKGANGTGAEQVLWKDQGFMNSTDWSADGRHVLVTRNDAKTQNDIWLVPVDGSEPGKPVPLVQSPFADTGARFMPGAGGPKFVSYVSNESGRQEVYVATMPGQPSGKWQVSNGGGISPRWRRDGRELFYQNVALQTIMAVDIDPGPPFRAGTPRALFKIENMGANGAIEPAADGQRFLITTRSNVVSNAPITVVLNWQAMLRK
jgi:Tol biopolymer transport system component/predicted Ser/Thr protein kinase